ncbi:L,D-transpeptidase family protein [Nocardioides mesophilus]|uniref:L,D-transpeptidase family protein n=1 Tax=Nocardioides mesophilus TaxID=433659 RepID=UPI001CB72483|nr:L,D-transpeptidase family protein [Nocardioides mesophilus]
MNRPLRLLVAAAAALLAAPLVPAQAAAAPGRAPSVTGAETSVPGPAAGPAGSWVRGSATATTSAERAQLRLNDLGCDAGPVDGRIGTHTRAALTRFQAANDLSQSGTLSQATRQRLYADQQVPCDRRPVVRSGTGRRVVISQHQNYVWLVDAKNRVVAEGGMVDNPGVLDAGRYAVGSACGRAAKIRMNSDLGGSLWLPYFTRFAPCGVGFHRVPVSKAGGTQIHPDWMLGTDLQESHGCIRLSRRLAARLWDFAGGGTRVVVR